MNAAVCCFALSLWISFPGALGLPPTSEPEVLGPPAPVFSFPGLDVVLPCHLKPELDVQNLTVEWSRLGGAEQLQYVHIYRNRRQVSTIRRTRLFVEQLPRGNISLEVLNVTAGDGGAYRCFIPTLQSSTPYATVRLVVGPNGPPRVQPSVLPEGPGVGPDAAGDPSRRLPVGVLLFLPLAVVMVISASLWVATSRRGDGN